MTEWIEKKSTNLKCLEIYHTCVCGRNGGRDAGIRLLNIGSQVQYAIKYLSLHSTDLMGSRNADEWSKVFQKMISLKNLTCYGMRDYIYSVDESTFDEKTSTVQYPHEERRRGSRFIGKMEKSQRCNTSNRCFN